MRALPRGDHRRGLAAAGVEAVDVDLEAKTVTVTGEPLDDEAIIAAIDDAGYEVVA